MQNRFTPRQPCPLNPLMGEENHPNVDVLAVACFLLQETIQEASEPLSTFTTFSPNGKMVKRPDSVQSSVMCSWTFLMLSPTYELSILGLIPKPAPNCWIDASQAGCSFPRMEDKLDIPFASTGWQETLKIPPCLWRVWSYHWHPQQITNSHPNSLTKLHWTIVVSLQTPPKWAWPLSYSGMNFTYVAAKIPVALLIDGITPWNHTLGPAYKIRLDLVQ